MEDTIPGQVPTAITSQETVEPEHMAEPELVPVDTLKRASREAKEARQRLAEERAKATQLEAEVHTMKQAQLEQQGKYKEMYEAAEKAKAEAEKEFQSLQQKVVTEKVSTSFMLAAKDAGCVDPQSLWKLADTDNLEVDENLKVQKDSVNAALAKAKETMPYMFQKTAPVIADTTPGVVTPAAPKPISEMNRQELNEYLKNNAEAMKKQFTSQGF